MRIMIFAAGGDIGGGKTHILSIARELSKTGELRLVSFRRSVLSREARETGMETADIDASAGFLRTLGFAAAQYDEFKPDIVHCHGAKANVIGMLLKIARRATVMSTVHSDPKLDYMGTPFKQYTNGLANQFALRCMDYLVAVSGSMKELLIRRGHDPYRIYTIYNGMDFSSSPAPERAPKAEDEEITVGIAARLNPVKDIETLIRAFSLAYKKDGRLRLSIAGTGEDKEKLMRLAEELGLSEVVKFEGWISDIRSYFSRIDINVLSSLSETFPYSLLEGACVRCPALASDVGGISDLIENGVSGYLFRPGDVEAFSSYILKLASDAALRKSLADALYERARREFSLDKMVRDQREIYISILRRESAPRRYGAVLCGAYGRGNAGDEAILRAVLSELRSIDSDMPFWVMSRDPMGTSLSEGVRSYYIFNVFKMLRSLRKAKLFVNGGGTLIQDITSSRSLHFYLFTLNSARRCGCKVIMYGCGIGPLRLAGNRKAAGRVINKSVDIITLRDSGSMQLLRDIGVTKPEMIQTADPTVNLPLLSDAAIDAAFEQEGITEDLNMLAFCMRDWPDFKEHEAVARAADYAYERHGLTPIFIPFEVPRDIAVTNRLASMASCPHYVFSKPHEVGEYIGMLGRMRLVCGMRLHSLIFATAGGTPVIGVSYDVKVESFIRDIGSDAVILLPDLSFETLKEEIDKAVSRGRSGGEETRARLRAMEIKNVEAAKRLLEEGI